MAILPGFPGIGVAVYNAQGKLPEYADTEPNIVEGLQSPPSVVASNYIEVPPDGGPFWLKFYVGSAYMQAPHGAMFGFEDPAADVQNWMSYTSKWSDDSKLLLGVSKGYVGSDGRNPVVRSFQFDKLKILSGNGERDGLSPTERRKMESMGIFRIRILPGKPDKAGASQGAQGAKQASPISQAITAVTEKVAAKKSLSLGVAYTDRILDPPAIPVAQTSQHTYNDVVNHPIAIFQFKYRSRAELQRLLVIKAAPEPEQIPRGGLFLPLPATLVTTLRKGPQAGQQMQELQPFQPAQPASANPPSITAPTQPNEQMRPQIEHVDMHLRATPNSAKLSNSSHLASTPTAFEKLKFAEVRDLARKKYKLFDDLNGDEIEKLARQKHGEEMADARDGSLSRASRAFGDLTFEEVWDLAKKQYKDFKELNGREIQDLARQKYNETMTLASDTPAPIENQNKAITEPATSQPVANKKALDANNEKGKRSAPIDLEDEDEEVIARSRTMRRLRSE
ncbi:hypothetical protein VF21_01059 [Pseudogymnoascus sp. 05NY08]|nr:hypothetical protein VF21_01059 [Pseudogymnoascus sp. 05NY08]